MPWLYREYIRMAKAIPPSGPALLGLEQNQHWPVTRHLATRTRHLVPHSPRNTLCVERA
jgi:hypothetical protein